MGQLSGDAADAFKFVAKVGVDPKTVADQLGHGIGVNLDVYTQSGLEAQRRAVTELEDQIFSLSGVQRSTDLKWVS